MQPYRTIFIPAVPAMVERNSFFGGSREVPTDLICNGPALAAHCETACNDLHKEGYEIVSITEVTQGGIVFEKAVGEDHSGAGWSRTSGVLITARLRS